jgi:hypothetical protein
MQTKNTDGQCITSRENGDGINSQGSLINLNHHDTKTKRRGESIETY